MSRTYIVGAGPQGRIVLDILRSCGADEEIGFLDDDPAKKGQSIEGAPVIGNLAESLSNCTGARFIVAVGQPCVRMQLIRRIQEHGRELCNVIHPAATIMPSARLGCGVIIHPGAIVTSGAQLSDGVIVNTGAIVEHDTQVEAGACVSPGAQTGGRVVIGAGAFLGSGCIVLKRLTVGDGAIVAAGSIVTRDVAPHTLVMGSPARLRETIGQAFDWARVL